MMSGTPVGIEAHYEVSVWLNHEAELLDHLRWRDWLALLSPDIRYRMPVPPG
jgi:3-phenylpropionate/trans-cinnamate dioxygenase subunit beta